MALPQSMVEVNHDRDQEVNKSNASNDRVIPLKRGRPIGSLNKTGSVRYRPKKWLPEFNQLVLDYIAIPGITHKELGDKYGYTNIHVGNILGSPQAKLIQEGVAHNILNLNKGNVELKLGEIANKTVERIHDFMFDDRLYVSNPFVYIDKVNTISKGVGVMKSENASSTVNNTQINIGNDVARELIKSVNLAQSLRIPSSTEDK